MTFAEKHKKELANPENELPVCFRAGLFKLVFEDKAGQQFKGLNGYNGFPEAKNAAGYYKEGHFKVSGSSVADVYICQEIEPVYI